MTTKTAQGSLRMLDNSKNLTGILSAYALFTAGIVIATHRFCKRTRKKFGLKRCPNCGYPYNWFFSKKCTKCNRSLHHVRQEMSYQERGERILGSWVLVQLKYQDARGTLLEEKELFGKVIRIDPRNGIEILLNNSDLTYLLPPTLDMLKPVESHKYVLRSTGEVIRPDYISAWIVNRTQ